MKITQLLSLAVEGPEHGEVVVNNDTYEQPRLTDSNQTATDLIPAKAGSVPIGPILHPIPMVIDIRG